MFPINVPWEVGEPHNHYCSAADEPGLTGQLSPLLPGLQACTTMLPLIFFFVFYLSVWKGGSSMSQNTCRGQGHFGEWVSLLLLLGFWGLNSDHVAYGNWPQLLSISDLFYFMGMSGMCTISIQCPWSQKWVLDPLKQESHITANCHVGPRNQTGLL